MTGSNSVNVFLGLGLPWVISAEYMNTLPQKPCNEIYNNDLDDTNKLCNQVSIVPSGTLGFSVMLFLLCSLLCFTVLTVRRLVIGGELGGPIGSRKFTAGICVFLWVIYIVFSILKAVAII